MQNKSFTLIELLVVIAIIGLIATVVLVSMGGIQGKARITKYLEFSQSIQRILGAYAAGWWAFDEGAGAAALDGSGYGNNGTINGASYTDDTPHKAADRGAGKYALSFDGVNDYVNLGTIRTDFSKGLTIEAWVYYRSFNSYSRIIDFAEGYGGSDDNIIFGNLGGGNNLLFQVYSGSSAGNPVFVSVLAIGTWLHVAVTSDSAGNVTLYKNGAIVKKGATAVPTVVNRASNFIGRSNWAGDGYFNGMIDEVRVYEKTLTLGEIKKHYSDGLDNHKNLAIK